jgi:hypothetical protein
MTPNAIGVFILKLRRCIERDGSLNLFSYYLR